jgi:hypothetical protein
MIRNPNPLINYTKVNLVGDGDGPAVAGLVIVGRGIRPAITVLSGHGEIASERTILAHQLRHYFHGLKYRPMATGDSDFLCRLDELESHDSALSLYNAILRGEAWLLPWCSRRCDGTGGGNACLGEHPCNGTFGG